MKYDLNFNYLIKYVITNLKNENKINDDSCLVIPILNQKSDEIISALNAYNYKTILITFAGNDFYDLNENIEVITISNKIDKKELFLLADDVVEEYDNAYLLNLNDNIYVDSYITKEFGKKILFENESIKKVYIPYIYGGIYNYFYKLFKLFTNPKIAIIDVCDYKKFDGVFYDEVVASDDIYNYYIIIE